MNNKKKVTYKEVLGKTKCKPIDLKTKSYGSPNEQLSVLFDFDTNPSNKEKWKLMFLYVPNVKEFEHFHIELKKSEAKKLRDWLDHFIKETKVRKKKNVRK